MLCNTVHKTQVKIDCRAECGVIFATRLHALTFSFIPVLLIFSGSDFGDKYSQIRL
jgi:hypothetical protein